MKIICHQKSIKFNYLNSIINEETLNLYHIEDNIHPNVPYPLQSSYFRIP